MSISEIVLFVLGGVFFVLMLFMFIRTIFSPDPAKSKGEPSKPRK